MNINLLDYMFAYLTIEMSRVGSATAVTRVIGYGLFIVQMLCSDNLPVQDYAYKTNIVNIIMPLFRSQPTHVFACLRALMCIEWTSS